MRIKKLFSLTVFSFIGPFVATFFIVLFILLMQFLWKYIDDLVGKGLEWYVILELLFFASAAFVPLALPLSILLSSIMCFGSLSEKFELMALKTSGISLVRIMMPLIILVSFISIGAFFFSNNVIPVANLKFHSLLWDIRQQRPALDLKEGVFYSGIDNYTIRIGSKDKNSQVIRDITIYDHTQDRGNVVVITAKKGEMLTTKDNKWLILKLTDGNRYEEMEEKKSGPPTYPANRMSFKYFEKYLDLSGFKLSRTNESLFKDGYEMLNVSQLDVYIDSLTNSRLAKNTEVSTYSKPYYEFFKDSAFFSAKNVSPGKIKKGKDFIENFPKSDREMILQSALNTSRTIQELLNIQSQELDNYNKTINKYRIEWHRKFALSLACLMLFFIGAPLGAIIRKGGIGMPTVVSIFMFIVFYIITIMGEKSAKEGAIGVLTGMWMPAVILFPIGFWLTWKANRDSISFSSDAMGRFFRRVIPRRKRNENTSAV